MRAFLTTLVLCLAAATSFAQSPCTRPAPTIIEPANGATEVASPVTFRWTAVEGTYGYKVFGRLSDEEEFEQVGDTTATDFTIDIPANVTIEWYVTARFDECDSKSATATFSTTTCPVGTTTLITPNELETVGSPVTFRWTKVENALGYRVWLIPNVQEDEELEILFAAETQRTSAEVRVPPGEYVWFVETLFECDSTISDLRFFEVPRAQHCPTAKPQLLSPANGATVNDSPVTFSWSPVSGAIGYQVWASLDGGDYEQVDETTGSTSQLWVTEGTISWIVVAQFNGCDDVISDESTFTVPYNEECDNSYPYPISPADGATNVPTRVNFIWTPVDGASKYNVWIAPEDEEPRIIGSTTNSRLTAEVPLGAIWWAVEAEFNGCPSDLSPVTFFETSATAACGRPAAPEIYVEPEAVSGSDYLLIWSPGLDTESYEVQESASADFANAASRTTDDILIVFNKNVAATTRLYYRVRSNSSCNLGVGPWSDTATIVLRPDAALESDDADLVASYGSQHDVVQKIRIGGQSAAGKMASGDTFTAVVDKPWLRVEPASGTIPPEGLELTVTADPRQLPTGTNTATVQLTTITSDTPVTVPVSINLVTPVSPNAGTKPLPNSLIIPAVAHAQGAGTKFESDVRLANASAQVMKYLLLFTPTRTDGNRAGSQATIQVEPGETAALNDILRNFYGLGATGESVSGVLEIRPLQTQSGGNGQQQNPSTVTFASSRTYATGAAGTYGQFIPAIPFANFIGKDRTLSLQQIAQSAAYRTNLGIVEAAGEAASVLVSIFGDRGERLGDFPIDLKPGEHMQLGSFLASKGFSANDGRIEVKVTSATGRVTAYASVLDNRTNDPLLVLPVDAAQVAANRYILPGVAYVGNWRSDVRLFNSGNAPVTATLQFMNQSSPEIIEKEVTIEPGKVAALDNILQTFFNAPAGAGGSLVVTTPGQSKLVTTARTYNQTDNGTYGQFIPGITVGEGVGRGERALQILQVEQSDRFRTNVGIVELTGNPVKVEISATRPDSKVSVKTELTLRGNEFVQLNSVLGRFGFGTTYNARIALRVVEGTGRISGYGSLIDNRTQDPTYVPAQ
ncbi:MAG TPA: hypothetical protein VF618_09685 [Thermoanaerobaculia bacterium]